MPEFFVREHAINSPTQCLICNDSTGPFMDTNVDLPVYGHVYICMSSERSSGCVRQMGRFDKMIDPGGLDEVLGQLADKQQRIDELEKALGDKRVPAHTVLELLGR